MDATLAMPSPLCKTTLTLMSLSPAQNHLVRPHMCGTILMPPRIHPVHTAAGAPAKKSTSQDQPETTPKAPAEPSVSHAASAGESGSSRTPSIHFPARRTDDGTVISSLPANEAQAALQSEEMGWCLDIQASIFAWFGLSR